jgi:MinD-like ATPase involved in chromosome partitioning or flagellar assembly
LEAADGKRNRLGLIPYGLTARAASSKDLPELLKAGGLQVLPAVSYREAVAKAAISGLPLSEFQPNSLARREFSELAAAVNKALKAARK